MSNRTKTYLDGYADASTNTRAILLPEITRLRELVKAQKELIRELDNQISSESLHMDDLEYAESIRNKINQLENQDK